MAVTIQHLKDQATFEHGVWTSADEAFARLLNASIPEYSSADGRSDVFVARETIRRLGGDARIVNTSVEQLPPDAVP